jgi:hypothetical protein
MGVSPSFSRSTVRFNFGYDSYLDYCTTQKVKTADRKEELISTFENKQEE